MTTESPLADGNNSETFQELGFFGPVKKANWNQFIQAVQNNISNSRKEPGNISFALYQPENGELQPLWFERFKNKSAHAYHKEQSYFKAAIQVIQQSLEKGASSIELKTVAEIPIVIPMISTNPPLTRHVITLVDVRPDKINLFIKNIARATAGCRKAAGNLECNVYRYADDPNKFVLIEAWNSSVDYADYLNKRHMQSLNTTIKGFLASNSANARWLLADISQ